MKKSNFLFSVILIISIMLSMFAFSVSAAETASVSLDKETYAVGDTVTATISFNADKKMGSAEAVLKYDVAALESKELPGGTSENTKGTINFKLAPAGEKTFSVSVKFTVKANGDHALTLSDAGYCDLDDPSLTPPILPLTASSATVKAPTPTTPDPDPGTTPDPDPGTTPDPGPGTTPDPGPGTTPDPTPPKSSDATLGSLSVKNAILTPGFVADVTSYTATVKFQTEETTVYANANAGTSTVTGAGTFKLEVGDNKKEIIVVAEDGTKKVYQVNIKRLTEEETEKLEYPEIEFTPLDVEINGVFYHINDDLSKIAIPYGFNAGTTMYNDLEVGVVIDAEYTLYYLTELTDSSKGDFYCLNAETNKFERLNYISVNGRFYIVEKFSGSSKAPEGWEECEYGLHTGKVRAFRGATKEMEGFYVFYCYLDGERGFYRYDSVQNTIQRDPQFELSPVEYDKPEAKPTGLFERFSSMSFAGKAVIVLLFIAIIFIVTIVVLTIVKFAKGVKEDSLAADSEEDYYEEDEEDYDETAEEDFLPIEDESTDNFTLGDE